MLGDPWGIGFQAGLQIVHSDFYGTSQASPFGPGDNRNQFFFTGGLFRRAPEGGVQWGIAVDALRDEYYGRADLAQIHTEVSFVRPGRYEIGYWGAYGTKSDDVVTPNHTYQFKPISQNVFFLRRYFSSGGEGRLWAGFSGRGDGLIGGDLRLPLSQHWAIENRFNYLIPKERRRGRNGEGSLGGANATGLVSTPVGTERAKQPLPPIARRLRQRLLHGRSAITRATVQRSFQERNNGVAHAAPLFCAHGSRIRKNSLLGIAAEFLRIQPRVGYASA